MSSVRRLATFGLLLASTAVGCSSNDTTGAAPVTTPDGGSANDGGDGGKPPEAPCSEPVDQRPAGSSCIKTVSGRLVEDTSGTPVSLLTTVCGAGLCLLGQGDANGFTVAVNRHVDLDVFVVHVDGRPNHANVYSRLARSTTDAVVLASPIRVPRLDQVGPPLPAEPPTITTQIGAGDITLALAAGTVVELDFADAALEAEGRKLRTGRVSTDVMNMNDPKLVSLHALAPFAAKLTPAAGIAITLPATAGIADGTAVELVALDDTLDSPDTGKLKVVATATVTGGVAKSDPGTGLARMTWVGVRKKGN